jgi:hypothetical protein
MKKTVEILKEELKKEGVEVAEEVLEKTVKVVFEKVLPRVAVEEENAAAKSVAGVALMIYPALKPVIEKATDLNRDGQ